MNHLACMTTQLVAVTESFLSTLL